MDDGKRFLILSLNGQSYALPIARLLEITVPRMLQRDLNLTEMFAGKMDYRGKMIPVVNLKKILKLAGDPGQTLLVVNSAKGILGILIDAVAEILDTEQKPVAMPNGVINPSLQYYSGILRHKESIILLLNEDGLLP